MGAARYHPDASARQGRKPNPCVAMQVYSRMSKR